MRKKIELSLLVCVSVLPHYSLSQTTSISGFDDSGGLSFDMLDTGLDLEGIDAIVDNSSHTEKRLLGGNREFVFQQDLGYVLSEPSGIETNRSSLRFKWNRVFNKLFYVNVDVKPIIYFNNDRYLHNKDDSLDTSFNIKELYGQVSVLNSNFTLGKKIIIWGESDTTAVTDVISPQNQSDLVFTSLDESRIPQTMLTWEHYFKQNQLSLIINPDIKVNEEPVFNSREQNAESTPIDIIELGKQLDDQDVELGLRWTSRVGRGDFSIMLADTVDNRRVTKIAGVIDQTYEVYDFYKSYYMIGLAANLNFGDIALQVETAYNKDRAQQASTAAIINGNLPLGYALSDEVLNSITLKYKENGLRDWKFGLLSSFFSGDTRNYELSENNLNQLFFTVSNKFLYETLTLRFQTQYEIETEASIQRLSASYAFRDNFDFSLDLFNLEKIGTNSFNQSSVISRLIYSF